MSLALVIAILFALAGLYVVVRPSPRAPRYLGFVFLAAAAWNAARHFQLI